MLDTESFEYITLYVICGFCVGYITSISTSSCVMLISSHNSIMSRRQQTRVVSKVFFFLSRERRNSGDQGYEVHCMIEFTRIKEI